MRTRIGIAALFAVLLALPISVGLASTNPYPVGKAALSGTGSGAAFISRQLTQGQTHVSVRVSGLAPNQVVTWQITGLSGTLLSRSGSVTASSLGTLMVSDYVSGTLNVTSGSDQMTLCVYDYSKGALGTGLACGAIYGQPTMGSNHWW
jgi:hypothetical protein